MSRSVLPPEIVQTLLKHLATDDAFRAAFAADPGKALIALGADAESMSLCHKALASLGSKEEFTRAVAQLSKRLEAAGPFNVPFMFESGLKGLQD